MTLCTNRPEGFGPLSNLYPRILTSCFLDTILIPLCTWLYLLSLALIFALPTRRAVATTNPSLDLDTLANDHAVKPLARHRRKLRLVLTVLYYGLLLAQTLMCVLEIVRLSLAHLGVGLLPFTFVTLLVAGALRVTRGLKGRMVGGWRWATVGVWIALAVANGVKVAEEVKEGAGTRKGSKYPEADEITDVAVMVGVYAVLMVLEVVAMRF
ncbi:MAG: hypothetical protein LQ352_004295 [Teloschistes flavicans]|nr:MAG: hypothetical protein LQ352_004295 [Teloschistes flavicans]